MKCSQKLYYIRRRKKPNELITKYPLNLLMDSERKSNMQQSLQRSKCKPERTFFKSTTLQKMTGYYLLVTLRLALDDHNTAIKLPQHYRTVIRKYYPIRNPKPMIPYKYNSNGNRILPLHIKLLPKSACLQ